MGGHMGAERLYSYRDGRWKLNQEVSGSPSAIVVSQSGALWVGTDKHGLHRYRRTISGLTDEAEYLPQQSVTTLIETGVSAGVKILISADEKSPVVT
jgi:ligand-binding sensor domain-containing protein